MTTKRLDVELFCRPLRNTVVTSVIACHQDKIGLKNIFHTSALGNNVSCVQTKDNVCPVIHSFQCLSGCQRLVLTIRLLTDPGHGDSGTVDMTKLCKPRGETQCVQRSCHVENY